MRRQITAFEFLRLLASLLISVVVYFVASAYGEMWSGNDPGAIGLILYLLLGLFLPAFLATGVSFVLPSARYKMITGTLMLSGIIIWGLLDVVSSASGFWQVVGAFIRLSALMTGALLAVFLLKQWQSSWVKSSAPGTSVTQPATKMPRTSPILLGLSMISIPITYITIFASAFLVVGYSALLLLLLAEMPRVPLVLLAAAFIAPLVAAWVSIRALGSQLFAKPPFQPAYAIEWAKRPLFSRMIKDVCSEVGSREPDNVILHVQPTFFVTQQTMNTFGRIIQGRTLAIGMPLLPLLTTQEFQAVLAHEFAHFSGGDTFYSVWVAPVYRSLGESIVRMRETTSQSGGWVQMVINFMLIPSLLFLIIFYEFFASIDAIVSRSREFRADWIAASHFGSNAFIEALKKIVQYGTFFTAQKSQMSLESQFRQPYTFVTPAEPEELQAYLDGAMNAQENEFDSHPTLMSRIANLPVTDGAEGESIEAIREELSEDEAVLAAAYALMMKQIEEVYMRYQQEQAS